MSSKDQMFAKVILASKPTNGAPPLITMHWRYPRIIHAEVMTHRVFSRNARSSRAVPVATMLKEIREQPFVPWHWGKNQKGMQAGEDLPEMLDYYHPDDLDSPQFQEPRDAWWLRARNDAVTYAERYMRAGAHKQIANRLIEPFSFIDTLVTSTSWANFFHLRDHEDAEPHFHDLALLVREALSGATFQTLQPGDWHLPFILPQEKKFHGLDVLQKLSVARCARISYAPFDGDASIEKELQRYDMLVGSDPLHASPTEHQATPDVVVGQDKYSDEMLFGAPYLAGNLGPGWVQFRKTLAGEYVADVA